MLNRLRFLYLLLSITFFSISSLGAVNAIDNGTERILNFHSEIDVDTMGRVLVTETIRINVTGESISRGIIRTIPIYRTDIYGNKKRVDVNILSVKRDNEPEDYNTLIEGDDFAVRIGKITHSLSPAIYTYTIAYESYGHVGFFDNYDEIYWNITGNDWAFPIDSASATVHVPQGTKVISNSCYTGAKGSKNTDCLYTVVGDTIVNYSSSSSLAKGEGFTIATSFTPNIINRPPPPSKLWVFYYNHYYSMIVYISLFLLIMYFMFLMIKYSNRINKHKVIPNFNPPEGKSPASIRYIYKRKIDPKVLSAAILSMAVKGAISINNTKTKYILMPKGKSTKLTADEEVLYTNLFTEDKPIVLQNEVNSSCFTAFSSFWSSLISDNFLYYYYTSVSKYIKNLMAFSAIIIVIAILITLFTGKTDFGIYLFLSASYSTAAYFMLVSIFKRSTSFFLKFILGLIVLVLLIYALGSILSDNVYLRYSTILSIGFLIINLIFRKVFFIYTKEGLKFNEDLEGFKMYLNAAESNHINLKSYVEDSPEQYEKMLPYAIALDLEKVWSKKFEPILKTNNYRPVWYDGQASIISYEDFILVLSVALLRYLYYNTKPLIKYSGNGGSSRWGGGSSSGGSWSSGSSGRSSGSGGWSSGSRGSGSSGGGGGGGGGRGW